MDYREVQRLYKLRKLAAMEKKLAEKGYRSIQDFHPPTEGRYKVTLRDGGLAEGFWNAQREIFLAESGAGILHVTYWKKV